MCICTASGEPSVRFPLERLVDRAGAHRKKMQRYTEKISSYFKANLRPNFELLFIDLGIRRFFETS